MELTPTIAVHMAAAIGAVLTGPVALWARRSGQHRPRLHRAFGRIWVALMLVTAVSAIFIRDTSLPNLAGYTPIHLLVLVTFAGLAGAFVQLARRNIAAHARIMRSLYFFACIVAGLFTLLPQRYLGGLLWGWLGRLAPVVQHTPAWVWLLLAGLLFVGWLQSRDRRTGIAGVTATPLGLTLFSLAAVVAAFGRGGLLQEALALWLVAAVAVALPLSQRPARAWYDRATRSFDLAGSWVPMALILAMFVTRYVVAVRLALHPTLAGERGFVLPVVMLYGAYSGLFLGRAAQLWRLAARPAGLQAA